MVTRYKLQISLLSVVLLLGGIGVASGGELSATMLSGAPVFMRGLVESSAVWPSKDSNPEIGWRASGGMKMSDYMLDHPRDWVVFHLGAAIPTRIGPNTRFILGLPNGRQVESDAVLLTDSFAERRLWKAHEAPVQVTLDGKFARTVHGKMVVVLVMVGFPRGSLRAGDGDWDWAKMVPIETLEVRE